jgi:dolichol kinase
MDMAYLDDLWMSLPYMAVLWVYAGLILLRIIKKHKELNYVINELIIFGCYLVVSFLLPLMMVIPGWSVLIQLLSVGLLLIIPLIEYRHIKKWEQNGELDKIKARDYAAFIADFPAEYSSSRDLKRKLYHVFIPLIIIICYSLALALGGFAGMDYDPFGRFLIFNLGFVLVNFFTLGDLFRLNNFKLLPPWAVGLFTSAMKRKELESYSSPDGTIMAIALFFVLPFPIFASIAMLIGVSDAVASLVGKNLGKIKLKEGSDKKLEGTIAGALVGVVSTLLLCFIFQPTWAWYAVILLALVAGGVFALFDYLDLVKINDNLSVPIVAGLLMGLLAWSFGLLF